MNRSMLALIAIVVTLLVNVSGVESIKAQEESFMIDPNTDDYHIRYKNVFGEIVEVTFIPATKIVPIVKSHFRLNKEGKIEYGYHLKNSDRARQNIVSLLILSVSRVAVDVPASQYGIIKLNAPAGWEGVALADDMSDKNNKNLNVSWTWDYRNLDRTEDGIKPGESQGRLAIHSSDLPGVTIVRLRGGVPTQGFPDSGPDPQSPVGKQFNELHSHDYVVRYAAAPKIPTGNPLDPVLTLTGLQKHLNQDLVSMKLVDPIFASQLDRGLQAAIDAAKLSNTKALKDYVKDLRKALKKEHDDVDKEDDYKDDDKPKKSGSIDKLAAKVLDFDLKYVEKRVGGKGDD